jgi:hypothetical protein
MLDIVKDFGVDNGDKIILNKKSIDMAITELNRISKLMQKMRSRGGIVLVQENDVDITTYDLNSFDINLKH